MELNFTELDNINTKNPFDYNSYNNDNDNYWNKKETKVIDTKKKKTSFNDILNNMNLVVNKEGVLQFMTPINTETNPNQYNPNQYNPNQYNPNQYNPNQYNPNQYNPNQYNPNQYNPNDFSKNNYNQLQQNQIQQRNKFQQPIKTNNKSSEQVQRNNEPLDPNLKHSYIYNKYFKNYIDNNVEKKGPRVPRTLEEYKRMLLEDKIKAIEHKKRIEQIKSKKLMFTTNPTISINPRNIQATKNSLRMMNFR
jgi:hypothetical protein